MPCILSCPSLPTWSAAGRPGPAGGALPVIAKPSLPLTPWPAPSGIRKMNNRSDSTPGPRPARTGLPPKQGLYDPWFEHDACGVGFVVDIKGRRSHQILQQALQVLTNLDHRGASGSEPNTGDGAGVLLQMPHGFFKEVCKKARIALP